ncbi:MAG: hypothetical protein WCI05_10350 [Myxococcales bacterium]
MRLSLPLLATLAVSAAATSACSSQTTTQTSDAGGDTRTETSDAGADTQSRVSTVLFVGTDFAKSEAVVVGLEPPSILGRIPIDDGDSVASASEDHAFVLERTTGLIHVLDPVDRARVSITLSSTDTPDSGLSNPRAVVVAAGSKAYVLRYAKNQLKVIDLSGAASSTTIDLSSFMAAADPDGLVDVRSGIFDPSTQLAYVLLQRIDQTDFSGTDPDYVARCLPVHGAIVGIDTTTDQIVDLNGDTPGTAIELLGINPNGADANGLAFDSSSRQLLVANTGCYEPGQTERSGRGIEAVDLATGTSRWLYQTTSTSRVDALVWVNATTSFVQQGGDWYAWNPTQPTLGNKLSDFPKAPVYDRAGRIVGLSKADGGWSVVAFDLANGLTAPLATSPFLRVDPSPDYGLTSALVR